MQKTNLLSDKTNFQNRIQSKGKTIIQNKQIRRRKDSYWNIYVHKGILKETHKTFRQSDKQTNGGTDGQTCGWADIGKDI